MVEAVVAPLVQPGSEGEGLLSNATTSKGPDTAQGTPAPLEDQADGDSASATAGDEAAESDIENDTPDEDGSEEGGFEKRFKDTQAKLTETSQELSDLSGKYDALREEHAGSIAAVAEASHSLRARAQEVDGILQQIAQPVAHQLQQLNSMQVSGLSQEQYGQWQATRQGLEQQLQGLNQMIRRAQSAYAEAHEREQTVTQRTLDTLIPDFAGKEDAIYQHALKKGISERTLRVLNDPYVINLIEEDRLRSESPDAIREVQRTGTGKRRQAPSTTRPPAPAPKTLAEKLYGKST